MGVHRRKSKFVPRDRNAESPPREHIFPNTYLQERALKWKNLVAAGKHAESREILEEIIIESTQMFERLAQHEDFHLTVDLSHLISAAQSKVYKWLEHWNPKKGKLFTWFSKCAKNAFRSEIVRVTQFRRRIHVTGDNLEKFFGTEDHEIDRRETEEAAKLALHDLTTRFGDPQELGAIRYMIECIVDVDNHSKPAAVRGAAYAYGISPEHTKFLYSWCLFRLRDQMYEKIRTLFTEQDVFRMSNHYNHLVDLLDVMSWDQMKKVIATLGGVRLRIPTMSQLVRAHDNLRTFEEIDSTSLDPHDVELVGKRQRKSLRTAQEVYEEIAAKLVQPTGEFNVFE